jgi:hypothetical protein
VSHAAARRIACAPSASWRRVHVSTICRVLADEEDVAAASSCRKATQATLDGLSLLGVSAPESMCGRAPETCEPDCGWASDLIRRRLRRSRRYDRGAKVFSGACVAVETRQP